MLKSINSRIITQLTQCRRQFCSSNIRCIRNSQNSRQLVEIGRLTPEKRTAADQFYQRGQLFIHKIFAYRGIINCSSDIEIYAKKNGSEMQENWAAENQKKIDIYNSRNCNKMNKFSSKCYHVLVESNDWNQMNFSHELMSYLHSNGDDENARLSSYNGMDLVLHEDILPYEAAKNVEDKNTTIWDDPPSPPPLAQNFYNKNPNLEGPPPPPPPPPINNPHYGQIFNQMAMAAMDVDGDPYLNGMYVQFKPEHSTATNTQTMLRNFNPIFPRVMFKQFTGQIEISVLPLYLGPIVRQRFTQHFWSCIFRVINYERTELILRRSHLEVGSPSRRFSFTSIEEETKFNHYLNLTPSKPATQFSANFELSTTKGNNLWGHFEAEYKGEIIRLRIPTISLDVDEEMAKMNFNSN